MRPVIHRFSSVTSTQDEARRLISIGRAKIGHVVIADEQTAGRGRFGRTWLSPNGGLYVTYLIENDPQIALRSGVAMIQAIDHFEIHASLKWPNDILLGPGKLAGILIDAFDEMALIGIGVNLVQAPMKTATSLKDAGAAIPRGEFLVAIWEALHHPGDDVDLLAVYRDRCRTIGSPVRVMVGGGKKPIEGIAVDVDADGRLGVKTVRGVVWISSGDCEHLYNVE